MKGKENKHIAQFRQQHLKPSEKVEIFLDGWVGEMMGKGEKAQRNGVLALTSERVAFYRKGLLGEVLQTIPISKLTSVEIRSSMGHRVIRLHTSHDDLAFKTFEDKTLFDQLYSRIEETRNGSGPSSVSISPPQEGLLGQIKSLGELRDAGILTETEFAEKKAELLSKL